MIANHSWSKSSQAWLEMVKEIKVDKIIRLTISRGQIPSLILAIIQDEKSTEDFNL